MNQATAIKKLRAIFGKKLIVRVDDSAPPKEAREAKQDRVTLSEWRDLPEQKHAAEMQP